MKPDWKDAPEWADWLAMDPTGYWWWYASKPEFEYGEWLLSADGDERHDCASDRPDESGIDWDFADDTLEPRP